MVSHPPHPIAHSVRWLAGYGALLAITFSLLLSAGGPTQGDTAERPPVDRRGTPAVPSRASIDELVSDLRLQIQLAFRRDVEERALRLRETQEAIGLWKQSPRSAADEEVFRNWLRRAIRHSMPGARGGLGQLPGFSSIQAPATRAIAPTNGNPQRPTAHPAGPQRRSRSSARQPVSPSMRALPIVNGRATQAPHPERIAQSESSDRLAGREGAGDLSADPFRDDVPLRGDVADPFADDGSLQAVPQDPDELLVGSAGNAALRAAEKSVVAPHGRRREHRDAGNRQPLASKSPAAMRTRPNDSTAHQLSTIDPTSPMADDKVGVVPPRPVAINVAELSARITGYELKLREVRADLHRLESLDAPALARLSSELDDLAAARDFIQLYLKNLNADQRAMLGVPQAVDDVVGLVGRTVQRRRAALAADRWQPEVKNDYELLTTALTRLELLWRELADKR